MPAFAELVVALIRSLTVLPPDTSALSLGEPVPMPTVLEVVMGFVHSIVQMQCFQETERCRPPMQCPTVSCPSCETPFEIKRYLCHTCTCRACQRAQQQ